MQTILIPTDFNLTAFNCIPSICNKFKGENINLIFVHMFKLSDSITDLLMLSRRSREFKRVDDEFYNTCALLKRNNAQINDIKVEFLYGSTLRIFKNFLEDNEVSYIIDPADCSVSKIHKSSVDFGAIVHRAGIPVIRIEAESTTAKQPATAIPEFQDAVLAEA